MYIRCKVKPNHKSTGFPPNSMADKQKEARMPTTKQTATGTVYQFKITLKDSKPPVWRRIQVTNNITLSRFSATLLTVMGWNGGHLHELRIGDKDYGMPDEEFDDSKSIIDEKTVRLRDLSESALKRFIFVYDFGDGWEHEIELEKVLEPEYKVNYPVCLDGARTCPPDDCGGTGGYEDFLEAIRDSKHPEHESMLEWIGGKFDPEEFNVKCINRALKRVHEAEALFKDF